MGVTQSIIASALCQWPRGITSISEESSTFQQENQQRKPKVADLAFPAGATLTRLRCRVLILRSMAVSWQYWMTCREGAIIFVDSMTSRALQSTQNPFGSARCEYIKVPGRVREFPKDSIRAPTFPCISSTRATVYLTLRDKVAHPIMADLHQTMLFIMRKMCCVYSSNLGCDMSFHVHHTMLPPAQLTFFPPIAPRRHPT